MHRHVSEAVADHLVGGQRPAELLAHFGVFQRHVEHDLHDADRLGAEGRQRAIDHGLDLRQCIAVVAEQGVGGKADIGEIEVAGPAAAEPRVIAQGEAGRAGGNKEQGQFSGSAVVAGNAGRNDDLPRRMAIDHGDLVPVEPPAVGHLHRRGLDFCEIEARGSLRMREGKAQRSVGDLWQHRLLLRLAAAFGDQAGADHHRRQIGLGNQPAPKGLHHDAGLDRARTQAAIFLRNRQRQPAEIGELFPDRRAEAERIARAAAAVIGIIGFRDKAVDTFAQQALFVAEVEVHLIYFTAAVFLTEGCSPAGSTTMPNSCRLCA